MNQIVGATTETLARCGANTNATARNELDFILTRPGCLKTQVRRQMLMKQMIDLEDLPHRFIRMRHNRSPGVLIKQGIPEKVRRYDRRAP